MFWNNHVRLIGAGQKRYFKNSHFRFKSPTPPRQSQIHHPRDGLSDQIPDSPGKENIQMPGVCPGGMLMFRIDRRISSIPGRTTLDTLTRAVPSQNFGLIKRTQLSPPPPPPPTPARARAHNSLIHDSVIVAWQAISKNYKLTSANVCELACFNQKQENN